MSSGANWPKSSLLATSLGNKEDERPVPAFMAQLLLRSIPVPDRSDGARSPD